MLGYRGGALPPGQLLAPDSEVSVRAPAPYLRLDVVVLAVAMAGGLALRLVNLNATGLNSDEAVYAAQAASLVGNERYTSIFPVFRAHPLVFQSLMSPIFRTGVHDYGGRLLAVAFGLGTIGAVYALGTILYSRRVGAIAALFVALMPYHVTVSRQILLDGPMTFFLTVTLCCLALLARTENPRWLIAAAASLGVATLTKETAAVMVGAVYAYLAFSVGPKPGRRPVIVASACFLALVAIAPVTAALAGGSRSGVSYLTYQLNRRPNHGFSFYFTEVPVAIGLALLLVAAAGLLLLRRRASWRESLLLVWILVPLMFFEVWPVKGFQYLLPLAPPLAVLAARALVYTPLSRLWAPSRLWLRIGAIAMVAVTLIVPTLQEDLSVTASGLAGSGGMPGGREAGEWVAAHVPPGSRLMTIGPSMANVLQYYGSRPAQGLSVSANPLHRNPSYDPIPNPDAALRSGEFQYVVWDVFSATRSPYFANRTLKLVRRYHGRVVHTETAPGINGPVIIVYEVHP